VTLALQAKPVNKIHIRENRRLVIPEHSFMAASPKTVIRKNSERTRPAPKLTYAVVFALVWSVGACES
jgi:hypothetical protein